MRYIQIKKYIFNVMLVDDTMANLLSIKGLFKCFYKDYNLNIICKTDGMAALQYF